MFKKLLTTRSLCVSAVIAALYAALTILLAPISYGAIQLRVSEAMTLLPILLTMGEVALGEVGAVLIGFVILGALKRARIDFSRLG